MNTREREEGQAVLLCLLLLMVLGGILAVIMSEGRALIMQTETERLRLQAQFAAESGRDFALMRLNGREWSPNGEQWTLDSRDTAVRGFQSTDMYFVVTMKRAPVPMTKGGGLLGTPPVWKMTSTGFCNGVERTIHAEAADAHDLMSHLLNVTSFAFSDQSFANRTVDIGGDGVAVRGMIEQIERVPDSCNVSLASTADRYFSGVMPGTVRIFSSDGRILEPDVGSASVSENHMPKCRVDYSSGVVSFSEQYSGNSMVVFHDYNHRIPLLPGPLVAAYPYATHEGRRSVSKSDLHGFILLEDAVYPRVQTLSRASDKGLIFGGRYNTSQPVPVDYSFYGSRMTGSIRINGSIRWHNRNALFLLGDRGDTVEITGTSDYTPNTNVLVVTEDEVLNARSDSSQRLRRGMPYRLPVPIDWHFYRRMADRNRGGNGIYIDNPQERQDPEKAVVEWKHLSHDHWKGVRYGPPGRHFDLSDVAGSKNGIVFAEGNVRVRGIPPTGTRTTIISAGSIYIESDLGLNDDTSVALIARDHICLNATELPSSSERLPDAAIRALIYSMRGTFGVVPRWDRLAGDDRHNQLFFMGSINENWHYDSAQWARAFGSMEWLYDARYRDPKRRPSWLCSLLISNKHWKDE